MTLIEALKSGKRIRHQVAGGCSGWVKFGPKSEMYLTPEDILSDLWEVEPDAKPRMLAWYHMENGRLDFTTGEQPQYTTGWTRCPWLDEPESK